MKNKLIRIIRALKGMAKDYDDSLEPQEVEYWKKEIEALPNDDKLITEQFLISKGWKKVDSNKYCIVRGKQEQDVYLQFESWHEKSIIICGDDNHYDFTWYNGPIPTESQYHILSELIKIHP